eukprot:gnl/Dysnectes_brevis/634_a701_2228.p1 GENE.gnl/Dysnectes_brevis/634_a701_2228~~gnl/Dysnectes_brevis/634_a701_2228.p1  ORF type:complete len:212 (-),score=40.57 gnl/Dysnectes_brevis/634_a701_2228:337-972(-)
MKMLLMNSIMLLLGICIVPLLASSIYTFIPIQDTQWLFSGQTSHIYIYTHDSSYNVTSQLVCDQLFGEVEMELKIDYEGVIVNYPQGTTTIYASYDAESMSCLFEVDSWDNSEFYEADYIMQSILTVQFNNSNTIEEVDSFLVTHVKEFDTSFVLDYHTIPKPDSFGASTSQNTFTSSVAVSGDTIVLSDKVGQQVNKQRWPRYWTRGYAA